MESFLTKSIKAWRIFASLASGIALLWCFALGFRRIAAALHMSGAESPVPGILAGLELFFLAPLPYLSLMALTNYLESVLANDRTGIEKEYVLLQRAKHLVFGLMIAVLATNGIEALVSNQMPADVTNVILRILASSALILVIGLYARWSREGH